MKSYLKLVAAILIFSINFNSAFSQVKDPLPRSTPEQEGVSSDGIIRFLDAAASSPNEFHSIMIIRHGKVIAEGWWDPYKSELKHTMYSTSKSFTATAVGFAISEKKLNLSDKVTSFFPKYLPDTVTPFLSDLTVKDVLSMSDGMDPDPTGPTVSVDSNWIRGFLARPILYKPGTKFLYNSLGTYMLSAIVQKVTGEKEIDYLKPRLFEPLGIQGMDWETDLQGINTGGWGLRIHTEDMAKFGLLFLQKGKWKDKQVIPASWVEEASSSKIIQHPDLPQSKRDSSDWEQGYCYQMWRCRHNGYRADGAFGQFIIVLPGEDAVIAITAETPNMQNEINLVWDNLLTAMHKDKLPESKASQSALTKRLASLSLFPPAGKSVGNAESLISGKTFSFGQNDKNINSLSFNTSNNVCHMVITSPGGSYDIAFGNKHWEQGSTNRPGPNLLLKAKEDFTLLAPFKIAGSYSWKDEHTIQLVLRYIESPHSETFNVQIANNEATVEVLNSYEYGSKKTILKTASSN